MNSLIKNKNNKKRILITSVALGVLLISACTYIYINNSFNWNKNKTPSINYNTPTDEQKKAGDLTKRNTTQSSSHQKPAVSGSDTPHAPTSIPGSEKKEVEVVISSATQNDSTLQIRSIIYALVDIGECTAKFVGPTSQIKTYTSDIQPLSSTSTCKGFNIPISELAPGSWQLTITYDSETLTGSTNKTISIQ